MITVFQYFAKPHTEAQKDSAVDLLSRVEALRQEFYKDTERGPEIDPDTRNEISGTRGGDGDGGFRTPRSTTGAPNSSHRQAAGVDCYDPEDHFDSWLDRFERDDGGNTMLQKHGLYREHPSATSSWVHLTTRPPGSGKRTFNP